MMSIKTRLCVERERWIILRVKDDAIFCGLAQSYTFKTIDKIGNISIKTYESKKRAEASFSRSWDNAEDLLLKREVIAVPVMEKIDTGIMEKE